MIDWQFSGQDGLRPETHKATVQGITLTVVQSERGWTWYAGYSSGESPYLAAAKQQAVNAAHDQLDGAEQLGVVLQHVGYAISGDPQ